MQIRPHPTAVPCFDSRAGGLVAHAVEQRGRAMALHDECLSWLPAAAGTILPLIDGVTRQWLKRSASPYVGEIEAIADAIRFPGIWFLNGCYQWGCTAHAREEERAPWLARTLDWPFPGLGRHVEIVRMTGEAGDFDNVTWPGYVGALTASAPGRFAAAINQAPLRRRTRRPWLRPFDLTVNALRTWRVRFIPPDHLLREVFERCRTFSEAKRRLETTPIARPVIYTLVGCEPGEYCVIERTEQDHASRNRDVAAANDWFHSAPGWEARVCSELLWVRSYDEARENSRLRREALTMWQGSFAAADFAWVMPPVLNPFTRVAAVMCPARGLLHVTGYERTPAAELPQPVTGGGEVAAMA